jgi:hypothetical protein
MDGVHKAGDTMDFKKRNKINIANTHNMIPARLIMNPAMAMPLPES